MKKNILIVICLILGAIFFSGCRSYCELCVYKGPRLQIDNDEEPLATFDTINLSYKLFGIIPLSTGLPWAEGSYDDFGNGRISFFSDQCTLDNNITTLRSALKEVNSNRITNLVNIIDTDRAWSLFLIHRKYIKTTCIILKPHNEGGAKALENKSEEQKNAELKGTEQNNATFAPPPAQ